MMCFFAGNINRYSVDPLNYKIDDAKRDLIQAIRDDLRDDQRVNSEE